MKKIFPVLIMLIAAGFALTGCGSSGQTDTAAAETSSAATDESGCVETISESGYDDEKQDSPLTVAKYALDSELQYLPEEAAYGSLPENGVYILYTVNSADAGRIDGDTLWDVGGGKAAGHVTAIPSLGYKFVRWSDGVTTAERSGDISDSSRLITAVFDYELLDMPALLIETETGEPVQSKTVYVNGSLSIIGCDAKWAAENSAVEIRGRGNNTWSYDKKSYKFKLAEKANLFGLANGRERVWVLLANHCDQSLLRNHFALELARCFGGIDWSPASVSVELYLNGEYVGVYLLAEEIKTSGDRVDITVDTESADTGFLIELSNYADGNVIVTGGRTYRVSSDLSEKDSTRGKQLAAISDFMDDCWQAVKGGDRQKIESLIDIDSCVDCYLVEEISKNLDQGWDSFYLYRDKGGKLHLGPMWDFDLSFGNSNEGCQYYDGLHAATTSGSGGGNPWFYTLMNYQWFRDLARERWNELHDIIFSLPDAIRGEAESGYDSYCRNFTKWKIFGQTLNRETELITSLRSYDEHYKYLAQWTENRLEWLDEYYRSDDYSNGVFAQSSDFREQLYAEEAEDIIESYSSLNSHIKPGSVDAPDGFPGEDAENLFDDSDQTKYCWLADGTTVISFRTDEKLTVRAYALKTANDTSTYAERNPDSWELYGSTDGKSWTLIDSRPDGGNEMYAVDFTYFAFECGNDSAYDRYRLVIYDSETCQLCELLLLG